MEVDFSTILDLVFVMSYGYVILLNAPLPPCFSFTQVTISHSSQVFGSTEGLCSHSHSGISSFCLVAEPFSKASVFSLFIQETVWANRGLITREDFMGHAWEWLNHFHLDFIGQNWVIRPPLTSRGTAKLVQLWAWENWNISVVTNEPVSTTVFPSCHQICFNLHLPHKDWRHSHTISEETVIHPSFKMSKMSWWLSSSKDQGPKDNPTHSPTLYTHPKSRVELG